MSNTTPGSDVQIPDHIAAGYEQRIAAGESPEYIASTLDAVDPATAAWLRSKVEPAAPKGRRAAKSED